MAETGATLGGRSADQNGAAAPTLEGLSTVVLFPLATLLIYLLFRQGTVFVADEAPQLAYVWLALLAVAAGPFYWVRYAAGPAFIRRLGRASAVFLVVYFISEPFDIPYVTVDASHPAAVLHAHGRWLGLVLGVAAWFRPAALFAGAMLLWFMRDLHTPLTGFYFSNLDIRNVVEVMALAGIGFGLLGAARQIPRLRAGFALDEAALTKAALIIFAIGLGGHFGNYFFSAVAKLVLDGGPFSWLFGNRLYEGLPGALERGTFPFAASPAMTQFVYDAMRVLNLPFHIFSFAAQFAAVIAIFRRRWVLALTAIYDLFHIVVYLTFGLIFWKWIALNTIFLVTLATIPDRMWTRSVQFSALAAVLAGAIFFRTATLAWYDSPGFMSNYFEAETADGERYRVPSSYFATSSYQVSQARLYDPDEPGHFNFSIWGSVLPHDDLIAGRECKAPEQDGPPNPQYGPIDTLARYVWRAHERALERAGDDGKFNDRLYMHHHMPSPFVVRPIDLIDKRDIEAFYFVAESVCLDLENGRLKRDVLKRTEIELPRPE